MPFSRARKQAYKVMAEFISGVGIISNVLNLIVISLGGYFVYVKIIDIGDFCLHIPCMLTSLCNLLKGLLT